MALLTKETVNSVVDHIRTYTCTCTIRTGSSTCDTVRGLGRPWDPFGIAHFNLSGLLVGQKMIEMTTPIMAGPPAPSIADDPRVGPHGRGTV